MNLTKRQKIIIASILVSLGLLSTQLVNFDLRFRFILGLALFAYTLSLWALWQGINLTKAIILMIMPTFYTLAVSSFYFLLPVRWLTRIPVAALFGLSFYLLLLAQNIFNVAAIRTIPLYRAASTTVFLFTVITAFFIYDVLLAMHLSFLLNGVLVLLISFPLVLQVLWSGEMEDRVDMATVIQSFIISLVLGELGLVFSFWPMVTAMQALLIASAMYVVLGLTTQHLKERLTKRVGMEYLVIGALVLLVAFMTTSWTG